MENRLRDFILGQIGLLNLGCVRFEDNYYFYHRVEDELSIEKVEINLLEMFFKCFIDNLYLDFKKRTLGIAHNLNGLFTPMYSRYDMVVTKMNELNRDDLDITLRLFNRMGKGVLKMKDFLDALTYFAVSITSHQIEKINLKPFFEGFHQALITDLDAKHSIFFNFDFNDMENVTVSYETFGRLIYYIYMSLIHKAALSDEQNSISLKCRQGEKALITIETDFELPIDKGGNLSFEELKAIKFLDYAMIIGNDEGMNLKVEHSVILLSIG